jgi:hypothetical protein
MPKERFHLLLAEHCLPILSALPEPSPTTSEQRLAYLLGAISPDALFYDLPAMRLSSLGGTLHRLEGLSGMAFLASVISECKRDLTPETGMWLLGVAAHLLADGFWHPIIERIAAFRGCLHARIEMSRTQCHHWLESELESFWLSRSGPTGAYRELLAGFARPNRTREECIRCFRMLLGRLESVAVPDENRISRCLSWQAFLLHQFSLSGWARWRNYLLRFPPTRFWGTLIVPNHSALAAPSAARPHGGDSGGTACEDPFSDTSMARSVSFLVSHLPSLAALL